MPAGALACVCAVACAWPAAEAAATRVTSTNTAEHAASRHSSIDHIHDLIHIHAHQLNTPNPRAGLVKGSQPAWVARRAICLVQSSTAPSGKLWGPWSSSGRRCAGSKSPKPVPLAPRAPIQRDDMSPVPRPHQAFEEQTSPAGWAGLRLASAVAPTPLPPDRSCRAAARGAQGGAPLPQHPIRRPRCPHAPPRSPTTARKSQSCCARGSRTMHASA
jgi:hypothetical protein